MPHLDWYIRAQLKLRHLQLLVALDDYRSAARVAAHLHVTQPAISKMLAAIEKGVEAPLFERTARGLEPTEYGTVLVRHAREIMESLGNAHAEFEDIGGGRLTRVALGALPSTAVFLVPRLVATLEEETDATGVTIAVREGTMESLLPLLRSAQIDLVIGFLPAKRIGSEYRTEKLYEDPTVMVVRPGHPLTKVRRPAWKHLSDYPMILPSKGSLVRSAIDNFMAEHQVRVARRHLESVSTLANLGVLQLTDSVGFMQAHLARYFVRRGELSVLPLELPSVSMNVGLVWMADRLPMATRKVMDLLVRQAKDLDG